MLSLPLRRRCSDCGEELISEEEVEWGVCDYCYDIERIQGEQQNEADA